MPAPHHRRHRTAGTQQYEGMACAPSWPIALTTPIYLSACVWVFAGYGSGVGRSQLKRSSRIRKIRSTSQFIDYQYTIIARIPCVVRDRTASDKGEERRTRRVVSLCHTMFVSLYRIPLLMRPYVQSAVLTFDIDVHKAKTVPSIDSLDDSTNSDEQKKLPPTQGKM